MSNYLGEQPLAGLSASQIAVVEAACSAASSPFQRDGLRRAVAANIFDLPVSDTVLQAALDSALLDSGVPLGHLPPYVRAFTAGLNGSVKVNGFLSMVDVTPGAALGSNNLIVAAILAATQLLKSAFGGNGALTVDATKA
jgi:hypothetical protein